MITKLYVKTSTFLSQFKNDERGVTAIEYGLIGVAMAVLLAATLDSSGGFIDALTKAFAKIAANITTSTGS
ncbi:Flp family type IVb pilin [Vibrio cyclitrophicus]|uniref:Flp family type IVb pilin n=1 Tax=Vibrio cyclitrophicus TaxID=47951 RepID=UPI0002D52E72|nr:Flp family type IVb pilin [Vibrio cyclitrophicus]OCH45365.1 pilus assembly protein [Vibrio cyclitrophicus]OEE27524.1 pilus assembly protein [Vibrio cyclitrophicus ZF170]PME95408.1 pilus assembly protein [Vibrio cyclitrophicus]PMF08159.1 pilus assembly protein [Vibrio cyclitrophicus]PMF58996.1 pilus assembly protein [Vibrio cyclitrophicus]